MKKSETSRTPEQQAKFDFKEINYIWFYSIFGGMSIFFLKPDGEDIATWFQRIGSIIVIVGLFSEIKIEGINTLIFEHKLDSIKSKTKLYRLLSWIVLILGTAIWGYGDVIWVELLN